MGRVGALEAVEVVEIVKAAAVAVVGGKAVAGLVEAVVGDCRKGYRG